MFVVGVIGLAIDSSDEKEPGDMGVHPLPAILDSTLHLNRAVSGCCVPAGDVRRALEMLRRAVEIARQQHLADLVASGKPGVAAAAAAAAGAGSSHRHGQQQQQQPQGCEVEWQDGDEPLVERSHTRQAQSEMFSALHHQLLRSRSCWEKLLLVAVVVEARATGRSAVVIQVGR
jgi:hypothetical protein